MAAVLACTALALPQTSKAAEAGASTPAGRAEGEQALKLLDSPDNPTVQALAPGDLAILRATGALRAGEPEQAISTLQEASRRDGALKDDPLVAIIEAEAYRRSAIRAVARAGKYARNLSGEEQRLQQADLSPGMAEADQRLRAFIERANGISGMPLAMLDMGSDVKSVFLVDKDRSRLFVYQRDTAGKWQRVANEYVVTGAIDGDKTTEGDRRTPNGVYRFVKRLSGADLESRYGPVAFPIDYPNGLDRLYHKDGGGIWMHGYPAGVDRRPPRDTKGCFALPNDRLLAMSKYVHLGQSWVVVGEHITFDQSADRKALRDQVLAALDSWASDWSSRNTDAYLSHYHPGFHSDGRNLAAWSAYKRRVNASKSFIHVSLKDITLMRMPDPGRYASVVVADFMQHYTSDNYADTSHKRLYLVQDKSAGPWRILLEEGVGK